MEVALSVWSTGPNSGAEAHRQFNSRDTGAQFKIFVFRHSMIQFLHQPQMVCTLRIDVIYKFMYVI